jgi:hypothetical protein
MKLSDYKKIIDNQVEDWQDSNGNWLSAYDEAISCSLADLFSYYSERLTEIVSDNIPAYNDLTEENQSEFIDFLFDCSWAARVSHYLENHNDIHLSYGEIGEHYLQLDGIEKYKKSLEMLCPDITINDGGIYYYTDESIQFYLEDDYSDLFDLFADRINQSEIEILVSDRYGVYIPKTFVEWFSESIVFHGERSELERAENDILQGPDHPDYWENWDWVLNNCKIENKSGKLYSLWQEGDLFAISDNYIFRD